MIASSGRAGVDCGLSPLSVKLLGESHNYSSGSKATADTLNSAVHLGRVSSIDSEPDSEYEDELVFDDLDSPDPAGSSERPSASVLSSSRGLSPTDRYVACAHKTLPQAYYRCTVTAVLKLTPFPLRTFSGA